MCVVFIKLFKIQLHVGNKLNVVAKHAFKFTLVRNQSGFRFKCKCEKCRCLGPTKCLVKIVFNGLELDGCWIDYSKGVFFYTKEFQ